MSALLEVRSLSKQEFLEAYQVREAVSAASVFCASAGSPRRSAFQASDNRASPMSGLCA